MAKGEKLLGPTFEVFLERIPQVFVNASTHLIALQAIDEIPVDMLGCLPLGVFRLEVLAADAGIRFDAIVFLQFLGSW